MAIERRDLKPREQVNKARLCVGQTSTRLHTNAAITKKFERRRILANTAVLREWYGNRSHQVTTVVQQESQRQHTG